MKCALCERRSDEGFCQYHKAAREGVEAAYAYWKEAYGTLSWMEYLDRIKRDPRTGQWAKEVAGILGERSDKESS